MRKVLLLILVFVCSVAFGQGEVVKTGQKALTRNAKILKAHYLWEYNEPSDWINIRYCPKDEILLLASDEGDRYTAFNTVTQSSGNYVVEIYGGLKGDSLITRITKSSASKFEYQFPLGKGKPCSLGYTTYKVRVYPQTETKKITFWRISSNSNVPITLNQYLLGNFNVPTLEDMQFYLNTSSMTPTLKYVCLWKCINMKQMQFSFYNCINLSKVTLPKELDFITDMRLCFGKCSTLVKVKFPKKMNSLSITYSSTGTTGGLFSDCVSLQEVEFPIEMNNLTSLRSCFAKCGNLTKVRLPSQLPLWSDNYFTFSECGELKYFTFPTKIKNNITYITYTFRNCYKLEEIKIPQDTFPELLSLEALFNKCYGIKKIKLPKSAPKLENMFATFEYNYLLDSITFPSDARKINTLVRCIVGCDSLKYIKYPLSLNLITSLNGAFLQKRKLKTLILPDSMILCTDLNNNTELWELDTISTCVWGSGQVNTYFTIRDLKTFKQPTLRVSKLTLRGASLATASALHTIVIDWANSTYGGTTPQIDIRWNSLSATTINAIFTALPVVVGKTINVSGNPGSATCTPTIASSKGWTVII